MCIKSTLTKLNTELSNTLQNYNILSIIINKIDGMLWMKDVDDKYVFASKKLANLVLKCEPDDCIGKTDDEIIKEFSNGDFNNFGEISDKTDAYTRDKKSMTTFF